MMELRGAGSWTREVQPHLGAPHVAGSGSVRCTCCLRQEQELHSQGEAAIDLDVISLFYDLSVLIM